MFTTTTAQSALSRRDSIAQRLDQATKGASGESVKELVSELREDEAAQRDELAQQNNTYRSQVANLQAALEKSGSELSQVRQSFERFQGLMEERRESAKSPSE